MKYCTVLGVFFARWNSFLTWKDFIVFIVLFSCIFFNSNNSKGNRECFALPGGLYKWEAWSFSPRHSRSLFHLGPFHLVQWILQVFSSAQKNPPEWRAAVCPDKHKSLAWMFQPDVVWLYPGKELTNSYSMETIVELKNTVVSETTAKYILWRGWERTLYFSKVVFLFVAPEEGRL